MLLGRYEIQAELGRGATGVVVRAWDHFLGRVVAVKTMLEGGHHSDLAARFQREARHLSRLRHPHIVEFIDLEKDAEGRPVLVMGYVPGRSLRSHMASGLPLSSGLRLAGQVASALACAHEAGLIHRDLKPDNILVSDSGDARVLDFGLSRHSLSQTRLTATNAVLGTPLYMAPEQVSKPAVGGAADVYSLGVILYETRLG